MYNLDVNFLNDRPEYGGGGAAVGGRRGAAAGMSRSSGGGRSSRSSFQGSSGPVSNAPLIWGAIVGLGALGLSLLGWLGLGIYKGNLEVQKAEVQAEVAKIEAQEKARDKAKQELAQAQAEIEALTSVFSNIKPWSAMSQDLRERLPKGVQIVEIAQEAQVPKAPAGAASPAPAPSPAASPDPAAAAAAAPAPIGLIKIDGMADNFDLVNDFLVVLQKSNFLAPQKTRIVNSELMAPVQLATPTNLPGPDGNPIPGNTAAPNVKLPKLNPKVKFSIQTELADVPTAELLRELDRKGAVGLVTRIEALKEKGVIKP
jgi:type IV pilus assembly protein PilN